MESIPIPDLDLIFYVPIPKRAYLSKHRDRLYRRLNQKGDKRYSSSASPVKRSRIDTTLEEGFRDALLCYELWRCHQCGQCTPVCPSYRHGGIHTREVMERAHVGAIDLAVDRQIWQCTMCNACSERCQLGVDPAHVITILRGAATERGNVPQHFKEEAKLFISSGMSFPRTGLTKKMRREFGLEELEVSDQTMLELTKILERTTMGRVKLE